MPLKINARKAKNKIESFISDIDKLLELRYIDGEEKKSDLDIRIRNFAKAVFYDGKDKVKDYVGVYISFGNETDLQIQQEYEDSLKRKKRHLIAWKEEIELNLEEKKETTTKKDEKTAQKPKKVESGSQEGGFLRIIANKAKVLIDNDELFIKKHKHVEPVVDDLTISTVIVVRVIILVIFSIILEWTLSFTKLNPSYYKNIAIWFPALVHILLFLRRYKK